MEEQAIELKIEHGSGGHLQEPQEMEDVSVDASKETLFFPSFLSNADFRHCNVIAIIQTRQEKIAVKLNDIKERTFKELDSLVSIETDLENVIKNC